jgi:hypothetical protein
MGLEQQVKGRAALAVLLAAGLTVLTGAAPASAALQATLTVAPQAFSAVSSHDVQTLTADAVLTVTDDTPYMPLLAVVPGLGSGDGWHVTEVASPLAYSGPNGGTAIPAGSLAVISAGPPAAAGDSQPVDPGSGPLVPDLTTSASLDVPRMVLHADSGYGAGTYTQDIVLALTLPADTRAGMYTSTITTTIDSGP